MVLINDGARRLKRLDKAVSRGVITELIDAYSNTADPKTPDSAILKVMEVAKSGDAANLPSAVKDFTAQAQRISHLTGIAMDSSFAQQNPETLLAVRAKQQKIMNLVPAVSNAAKAVVAGPKETAAQEHFTGVMNAWKSNVKDLEGAILFQEGVFKGNDLISGASKFLLDLSLSLSLYKYTQI